MAAVTPTDLLKSVRNRCVIEDFGGIFVLSRCFMDFPVGEVAFVKGLSRISSFFSSLHLIEIVSFLVYLTISFGLDLFGIFYVHDFNRSQYVV